MNGVALPVDAPSVAAVLHDARLSHGADRQAALRAVPRPVRPFRREPFRREGLTGLAPRVRALRVGDPWRARATALRHDGWPANHPGGGRRCSTPCSTRRWRSVPPGGGETGAPQVHDNAVPREWYHTDWVADRTISWLDSLAADDDWFCWMSFPDPHHPWDPPTSELGRIDWRDVPAARRLHRGSRPGARRCSTTSPATGGRGTTAALVSNYEAPAKLGAGHADRRPGSRGQRPQRHRVRADRRGARPGA